jgi:hypothetical protein
LPTKTGPAGGTTTIPVTVADDLAGRGVVSYQFELTFDPGVLQPDVSAADPAGTLSAGLTVVANAGTPGRLRVAAFGANPLGGAGTLLNLNFRVVGAPGSTTALATQGLQLNEGDPQATSGTGQFTADPAGGGAVFQFASAGLSVPESAGQVRINVTRSGDTAQPAAVDYDTSDGTASERRHYTTASGRLRFGAGETAQTITVLLTDNALAEGDRTIRINLSNPSAGAQVVAPAAFFITIADDDRSDSDANPSDSTEFFVRQHYHDFLNREPDAEGLAFWVQGIESCGADAGCREVKRIDTSAAFFLSIEFQNTGFLVERVYRAAFKRFPAFREYVRDTQAVGRGVVVRQGDWEARLELNKAQYAEEFVARADFLSAYGGLPNAEYVDALNANVEGSLSRAERDALVAGLDAAAETRSTVLRKVAEQAAFSRSESSRAFVYMQYVGYLRRNPEDAPDHNFDGLNFWLKKLDQHGGDYRAAEMVKAFLISIEHRSRFGRP